MSSDFCEIPDFCEIALKVHGSTLRNSFFRALCLAAKLSFAGETWIFILDQRGASGGRRAASRNVGGPQFTDQEMDRIALDLDKECAEDSLPWQTGGAQYVPKDRRVTGARGGDWEPLVIPHAPDADPNVCVESNRPAPDAIHHAPSANRLPENAGYYAVSLIYTAWAMGGGY